MDVAHVDEAAKWVGRIGGGLRLGFGFGFGFGVGVRERSRFAVLVCGRAFTRVMHLNLRPRHLIYEVLLGTPHRARPNAPWKSFAAHTCALL